MKLIRLFESLSDDDRETLHMLQHDKEITGADYTSRMPALDKAMSLYGKPCHTPLYRGLPTGRGGIVGNGKTLSFRGYASFSESKETALKFAQESKTLVELTRARTAFCYYEWIIDEFRSMDQGEFEMSDGAYAIELSQQEAEWIFPFQSSFTVIGADPQIGDIKIIRIA